LINALTSLGFAEVNVKVEPLGLISGVLGVGVDIPVSSAWTLGPQLRFTNKTVSEYDVTAYSYGVRGNYWLNGAVFTQGWYIGPSFQFIGANVKDNTGINHLSGSASGVGLTGIFGYQWMWDKFNINLGAGPAYYSIGNIKVKDNQGNSENYKGYRSLGLGIEFNLGWKF
jgi:hypothetical protein